VGRVGRVALVDLLALVGRAVGLRRVQVGISESPVLVARAVPPCT